MQAPGSRKKLPKRNDWKSLRKIRPRRKQHIPVRRKKNFKKIYSLQQQSLFSKKKLEKR